MNSVKALNRIEIFDIIKEIHEKSKGERTLSVCFYKIGNSECIGFYLISKKHQSPEKILSLMEEIGEKLKIAQICLVENIGEELYIVMENFNKEDKDLLAENIKKIDMGNFFSHINNIFGIFNFIFHPFVNSQN